MNGNHVHLDPLGGIAGDMFLAAGLAARPELAEGTLAAIKARTSHLRNLRIGVMGCIVNGPGEMADADYGYVGAAPGRITLYKGREVVARNIPQEEALDRLVELIRENGDWTDN